MKNFKVKFFGSKEERGAVTKQSIQLTAQGVEYVESALKRYGWKRVHGLKIREICL